MRRSNSLTVITMTGWLVVALSACIPTIEVSPTTAPEVAPTGVGTMQNWHFELATFVRWPDSGFELPVIYSSRLGSDGKPMMVGRQTPGFGLGPNDTLLFWANNKVLQTNHS